MLTTARCTPINDDVSRIGKLKKFLLLWLRTNNHGATPFSYNSAGSGYRPLPAVAGLSRPSWRRLSCYELLLASIFYPMFCFCMVALLVGLQGIEPWTCGL